MTVTISVIRPWEESERGDFAGLIYSLMRSVCSGVLHSSELEKTKTELKVAVE